MPDIEKYGERAVQSFLSDPPDTDFQRGFLSAMLVTAEEALGLPVDAPPFKEAQELSRWDEAIPGHAAAENSEQTAQEQVGHSGKARAATQVAGRRRGKALLSSPAPTRWRQLKRSLVWWKREHQQQKLQLHARSSTAAMGSQRKFQTGDAKAFKKAIDMTDDELAAIAAGDPPDAGCDDDTFIEVEADFQPITLRRLVAT